MSDSVVVVPVDEYDNTFNHFRMVGPNEYASTENGCNERYLGCKTRTIKNGLAVRFTKLPHPTVGAKMSGNGESQEKRVR